MTFENGITIKDDKFGSKHLHINKGYSLQDAPFAEHYFKVVDSLLETFKNGAVFAHLGYNDMGFAIKLKEKSFTFEKFNKKTETFDFYKWNMPNIEDKIPEAASSVEGVAVIIISPDEKETLLVYEYEKWKFVTGSIKSGESNVETALREVKEEVGLEIDEAFGIWNCGTFQFPNAREWGVNDNCFNFLVKAKSKEYTVDGFEILKAKWYNIDELMKETVGNDVQDWAAVMDKAIYHHWSVHSKHGKMSAALLMYLDAWRKKTARKVHFITSNKITFLQ